MSASGATTTGDVLHSARAYDLLAWVLTLGKEGRFRERLVQLAALDPNESVLDVGCGTGALALAAKAAVGSGGQVCGVDPSPEMIARARRKAAKAGVDVRFDMAAVEELPFADGTFDAVLSTLVLHHLTDDGLRQGLGEIVRVLKPGGRFLAVDLGEGHGKHLSFHRRLRQHADFNLLQLAPRFQNAGLEVVQQGPIGGPRVIGLSGLRFLLATAPAP